MARLIRLELKKMHGRNEVGIAAAAILFSMFFVAVALNDSAGRARSFSEAFRTVEMIFAFIFVIFFSVLNAQIIISEYNNRTILILFTYPVNRKKVILAKLILITAFIAVSMLIGYLACGAFIKLMDDRFDWVAGTFDAATLYDWIGRALTTTVMFCALGIGTFAAGMWRKSVPVTIVSSVIFIYLRQVVVASTETYRESVWVVLTTLVIIAAAVWYVFTHKIAELE